MSAFKTLVMSVRPKPVLVKGASGSGNPDFETLLYQDVFNDYYYK
jgi:hypothetical protein